MRVIALVIALMSMAAGLEAQVTKQSFGKMADGTAVDVYVLKSPTLEAHIITYGAIIQSLKVPDKSGKSADVVLGFDSLDDYITKNSPHFGGIVGRYANRIAGGKFMLGGKTFTLPLNDGPDPQHHVNTLHGGLTGFDKAVWKAKEIPHGVELTHVSPDGDEGFPGKLTAVVRYTLVGKDLKIDYSATTDKDTVLNLTNHSYFNLAGEGSKDVLQHIVMINADRFTPVDKDLIPTGELREVKRTPLDFTKPVAIGVHIDQKYDQLQFAGGYDHNFVLNKKGPEPSFAARVTEPTSGRVVEVYTDQPGMQLYSGNFLDGTITGKHGHAYGRRSGFCLETQHFADSPNHPDFPSTILKPGKTFHSKTIYKFSIAMIPR